MWNNKEYGNSKFKFSFEAMKVFFFKVKLYGTFNSTGCYKQWCVAGSCLIRGALKKQ